MTRRYRVVVLTVLRRCGVLLDMDPTLPRDGTDCMQWCGLRPKSITQSNIQVTNLRHLCNLWP